MNISEAAKQGIKKVRRPKWNELAYLELPDAGPWAKLHDPFAQGLDNPDNILVFQVNEDDFEEYTPPQDDTIKPKEN